MDLPKTISTIRQIDISCILTEPRMSSVCIAERNTGIDHSIRVIMINKQHLTVNRKERDIVAGDMKWSGCLPCVIEIKRDRDEPLPKDSLSCLENVRVDGWRTQMIGASETDIVAVPFNKLLIAAGLEWFSQRSWIGKSQKFSSSDEAEDAYQYFF